MEFDDIEKILALEKEHDHAEFELERDGLKLRVKKTHATHTAPAMPAAFPAISMAAAPMAQVVAPAATTAHAGPPALPAEDELELAVVKSPIVGTFYRSPEPGAPSFVEIGQRVKKDQVLC